jgi:hypothetical protein
LATVAIQSHPIIVQNENQKNYDKVGICNCCFFHVIIHFRLFFADPSIIIFFFFNGIFDVDVWISNSQGEFPKYTRNWIPIMVSFSTRGSTFDGIGIHSPTVRQ